MNQISRLGAFHRLGHGFLMAVSLGLALVMSTSVVAADSHTGSPGTYKVTDTSGSAGANCYYTPNAPTHYLVSFSVRGPSVKWPSSSAAASGKVGWWAVVQKSGNTGWVTVKTGAVKTATVAKSPATSFARQTVKYAAQVDAPFRVVVHIAWYTPDNHVIGSATHNVAHYHESYAGWSKPSAGSCPGHEVQLGGI